MFFFKKTHLKQYVIGNFTLAYTVPHCGVTQPIGHFPVSVMIDAPSISAGASSPGYWEKVEVGVVFRASGLPPREGVLCCN